MDTPHAVISNRAFCFAVIANLAFDVSKNAPLVYPPTVRRELEVSSGYLAFLEAFLPPEEVDDEVSLTAHTFLVNSFSVLGSFTLIEN